MKNDSKVTRGEQILTLDVGFLFIFLVGAGGNIMPILNPSLETRDSEKKTFLKSNW